MFLKGPWKGCQKGNINIITKESQPGSESHTRENNIFKYNWLNIESTSVEQYSQKYNLLLIIIFHYWAVTILKAL